MIRPQYHFRRVGGRVHIWDVARLLRLAERAPVTDVALSAIPEIDAPYWFDTPPGVPTCRAVMAHAAQAEAADLAFPILRCTQGRMIDGMHRVMKALHLGHASIIARHIDLPPPDHVDVAAEDLPYQPAL